MVYNEVVMTTLETTQTVPLRLWEDGTIRITGSRVTVDSIVHHFKLGATAEQIQDSFPSLALRDIYGAIFYYLQHTAAVEEYLRQQETRADAVQRRIESNPEHQAAVAELRDRIRARWAAQPKPAGSLATD